MQERDIEIGLTKFGFITLKELKYKGFSVPRGFIFDGISIKAPLTFLFSNKDLRQGIRASCFHDFFCRRKHIYRRNTSTKVLTNIWQEDGLNQVKALIVHCTVNIYQWFRGWK